MAARAADYDTPILGDYLRLATGGAFVTGDSLNHLFAGTVHVTAGMSFRFQEGPESRGSGRHRARGEHTPPPRARSTASTGARDVRRGESRGRRDTSNCHLQRTTFACLFDFSTCDLISRDCVHGHNPVEAQKELKSMFIGCQYDDT